MLYHFLYRIWGPFPRCWEFTIKKDYSNSPHWIRHEVIFICINSFPAAKLFSKWYYDGRPHYAIGGFKKWSISFGRDYHDVYPNNITK